MKTLYLMCGVPGSGKSTWGKAQAATMGAAYISRDECRFSILKPDEDYFSHEEEVFDMFVGLIQEALATNEYVIADATHNQERSRNQLLDRLNLEGVTLVGVDFNVPLDVCLSQNDQRTGRANVPHSVIRRMWYQHVAPSENEKYHYESIIKVWKDVKE